MKYLKSGGLNNFSISSKAFTINAVGRIFTNSTNSLRLPAGTTLQRPDPTFAVNGVVRYNTDDDVIEGYIDGEWEIIKGKAGDTVSIQTIAGFTTETTYGPLDQEPASPSNIIVIVDTVFQIAVENYILVTDPLGTSPSRGGVYPPGVYIQFTDGDSVPTGLDITVIYGFDR
jgi:hypothetical protein